MGILSVCYVAFPILSCTVVGYSLLAIEHTWLALILVHLCRRMTKDFSMRGDASIHVPQGDPSMQPRGISIDGEATQHPYQLSRAQHLSSCPTDFFTPPCSSPANIETCGCQLVGLQPRTRLRLHSPAIPARMVRHCPSRTLAWCRLRRGLQHVHSSHEVLELLPVLVEIAGTRTLLSAIHPQQLCAGV